MCFFALLYGEGWHWEVPGPSLIVYSVTFKTTGSGWPSIQERRHPDSGVQGRGSVVDSSQQSWTDRIHTCTLHGEGNLDSNIVTHTHLATQVQESIKEIKDMEDIENDSINSLSGQVRENCQRRKDHSKTNSRNLPLPMPEWSRPEFPMRMTKLLSGSK